ncbi:MAG: hypothetical protein ACOX68_07860 [Candidatus Limivicinus sp.]|jgi:ABC-type glycerol-3-phosphate transport system substrate-binding protein
MSGNTPDIFDLSYFQANHLAMSGKLQDLKPFFEHDSEISYNDLIPSVAKALEYRGGAYVICPTFGINSLCTNSQIVNSENDWSLNKLYELIEEYGSTTVLGPEFDRHMFWEYVLTYAHNWLIDEDAAECYFDSDDFINLLKISSKFPSEFIDDSSHSEGRVYMGEQMFVSGQNVTLMDLAFKNSLFGGTEIYLPFPAGENNGLAAYPFFRLGMSSASKNAEGVWEFLKFILINDGFFYGIPNYQPHLSEYYKAGTNLEFPTYKLAAKYDGSVVEIESSEINDETVNMMAKLIERIDCIYDYEAALYNIIEEETQAYYAGVRSAEETARLIQSRASIYISEKN